MNEKQRILLIEATMEQIAGAGLSDPTIAERLTNRGAQEDRFRRDSPKVLRAATSFKTPKIQTLRR